MFGRGGGGGRSEIKAMRESDDKQKFKGNVPQGSWDLEWCVKAPFGVQRLRAVFTVGGTVCQIMTQQVELGGEVPMRGFTPPVPNLPCFFECVVVQFHCFFNRQVSMHLSIHLSLYQAIDLASTSIICSSAGNNLLVYMADLHYVINMVAKVTLRCGDAVVEVRLHSCGAKEWHCGKPFIHTAKKKLRTITQGDLVGQLEANVWLQQWLSLHLGWEKKYLKRRMVV